MTTVYSKLCPRISKSHVTRKYLSTGLQKQSSLVVTTAGRMGHRCPFYFFCALWSSICIIAIPSSSLCRLCQLKDPSKATVLLQCVGLALADLVFQNVLDMLKEVHPGETTGYFITFDPFLHSGEMRWKPSETKRVHHHS